MFIRLARCSQARLFHATGGCQSTGILPAVPTAFLRAYDALDGCARPHRDEGAAGIVPAELLERSNYSDWAWFAFSFDKAPSPVG